MLTKEAIEALARAQAISAANDAISAVGSVAALPNDFTMHDLEKYQTVRNRPRGTMSTISRGDFQAYVTNRADEGCVVFVDPDAMHARAILNLGTAGDPGQADDTATLKLQMTAPYKGLLRTKRTEGLTQQEAAEWLEDFTDFISCEGEDGPIDNARAVQAVRTVTIESMRKAENSEQSLSAGRTLMEQVAVKNAVPLPVRIRFTCVPYLSLAPRTFTLRLGVSTGREKPLLLLRIQNEELHQEEMAQEMVKLVREDIPESTASVVVGDYKRGA